MGSISLDGFGDLLTTSDLAAITGQSLETIRRMCREGEMPCVRIGRRFYIPKSLFIERIEAELDRQAVR